MLLKLKESSDYVAFPVGVTMDEAEALIDRGKKRKVKISGVIALGAIVAITIMLMILNSESLAPVAPTAVLVFGLSLMKFYGSSVELFGGRLFRKRLRRQEAAGKLVWVPLGLKVYVDVICRGKGMSATPPELFSYDMSSSRQVAAAYRQLGRRERRQLSEQLQRQIAALIDGVATT